VKKSASRTGDVTELEICHYFLDQGYEVFRNMSSCGPVDFVVLDIESGKVTLYDSKTVNPHTGQDGKCVIHMTGLNDVQKKLGVVLVGKHGDIIINKKKTIL
tara:strand:- start:63 stop:368 length:306 start_codon:yes stop_codon:yes gene_type:complete